MKTDITRDTFDPAKHFSRVLMQQGRVTLDADWNEQSSILLHYLRTLARDFIGPYAAPVENPGFVLTAGNNSLLIGPGRYYVDGILVENDTECSYETQPAYPVPGSDPFLKPSQGNEFWLYLDVWERHITHIEDDGIREKGLGNADTCTRTKVVWQVKSLSVEPSKVTTDGGSSQDKVNAAKAAVERQEQLLKAQPAVTPDDKEVIASGMAEVTGVKATLNGTDVGAMLTELETHLTSLTQNQALTTENLKNAPGDENLMRILRIIEARINVVGPVVKALGGAEADAMNCDAPLGQLVPMSKATLTARVDPGQRVDDACVTPPDSKYRGTENQLYRVEIHTGSKDKNGNATTPTFKWSRDNGSVATAWLGGEGSDLQVASTRGFAARNWVELSDDNTELLGQPGTLVQFVKVEGDTLSVDPATTLPPIGNYPANPRVRRWDHTATDAISLAADNAVPIEESPAGATSNQIVWIDLEDGVQIQFSAGGEYRTGDYWLIPARVATGNIEWPQADDLNPQPLPPHGVEHHYAPLGFVSWSGEEWQIIKNCQCDFEPLSSCFVRAAQAADGPGPFIIKPSAPTPRTTAVVATPIAPAEATTKDIKAAPAKRPSVRKKTPKARKRQAKKGPASPAEGAPS